MSTPFDSVIFKPLFSDDEVAALLGDAAFVNALVQVEIALARAEARAGIIPGLAAERIAEIEAALIDIARLAAGTARSGFPIIALVQELRKQAGADAAPFVHWGATTQDIMDTACVLQLRAITDVLRARLLEVIRSLAALAEAHRDTVLAGRTHSQQALPITFGLKVAGWIAPLVRHMERLDEIQPRLMVVQFGGAAGTLAALANKGLMVIDELAKQLKLSPPLIAWHTQRDGLVEFAGWLSLVTGGLGKMAQDIILLAQTEVGEVAESGESGRGGSSTMPQKSNPITSELIVAAARSNAALLSAMHQAQIQEHERGTHGWQMEWLTLPQMVLLTGGALKHARYLTANLQVHGTAMLANIRRGQDLILAEAAVFALSRSISRSEAEELVKGACTVAAAEARPFIEVIASLANERVDQNSVDWPEIAEPKNYLGEANRMLDAVLERAKALT
jgi:3-carboxy-cis,cis-muconate cycloisomerase